MKHIGIQRLVGLSRFAWLLVLSAGMLVGATLSEAQGPPPAPDLHFPATGAVMSGQRFTLRWQNHLTPPAAHFHVRIERRNPAANNAFTLYRAVQNATGGQYLDNFGYMPGTYRWRVRGYNNFSSMWGRWSGFSNFRVPGGLLDGPTPVSPRGVETMANPPANFTRPLRFRAVQGGNRYQTQFFMPERPGQPARVLTWNTYVTRPEGEILTGQNVPGLVPGVTYRWRVRSLSRVRRGQNQAQWQAGPWSPWVSYTLRAGAPQQGQAFLLRNFARSEGPPHMLWWRGYRFQVSRPIEVYALYGGGTGDFSMGLYAANGNLPTRRLRAIPGNLTGRRQRRVINPITLRPGQDYIIAQGRRSGDGNHYQLVGLENIRQHPILADWFPAVAPLRWDNVGNSEFIVNRRHLDLNAPPLDIGFDYR